MSRVFAYGRASTDRQQITLGNQEEVCQNYYKLRESAGDDIEWAGWFPDAAVSSTKPLVERPMGEIIFTNARKGDILLVSNFDRAFRSVVDCHNTMNILDERGIALVILDVDVNTKTPLGRAFMKIIAVLKELEREEIGRRTREALQYKKRHNKPTCSWSPIGWRRIGKKKDSRFAPEPGDRNWCKEIVRLREVKGMSFTAIEKDLRARKAKFYADGRGNSKGWSIRKVRKGYSAAKLGFPLIYQRELPTPSAVSPSLRFAHASSPRALLALKEQKGTLLPSEQELAKKILHDEHAPE